MRLSGSEASRSQALSNLMQGLQDAALPVARLAGNGRQGVRHGCGILSQRSRPMRIWTRRVTALDLLLTPIAAVAFIACVEWVLRHQTR